ncbi:thymidine phosphorylase [Pseudohalocynthiibacter aestuariivivens]|nr:thymidine phosphorylase [Pseudohalocynthiibacter aestuariivivens]QIE45138.1 thymidine phosphorylase [Pseudohalocynthiibacter aestuariivivens]
MDTRQIITALRDGVDPGADALHEFAQGLANGAVSDAQAGAFAMAVRLRGLGGGGRKALTLAMRDSGAQLKWDLDRPVIDKHSTGGIGDCVSLVLAPALAACGAAVPMISGRGLGHTGGTLDKLEAIPGLSTRLSEAQLRRTVSHAGCAIAAASAQIAPADARLYAVRDVTATVDSIDLICASILSKKLAAGLDALVVDVKTGSGAFMARAEDARALAEALCETANAAGCRTSAVISDMSQPLAPALGNALEVAEAMQVLTGGRTGRLAELSITLGGVLLQRAGLVATVEDGANGVLTAIADGSAAECFGRMVVAMGGPVRFVEDWQRFLPEATVIREVRAWRDGYVTAMDGTSLGMIVVDLGGGRQVESDPVDPSVGLSDVLPLGTRVVAGQAVCRIHAARVANADRAESALRQTIAISAAPAPVPELVQARIG